MSKVITCESCDWIGPEKLIALRWQRSGVSEHCPCCGSERLLESSPVTRRKTILEDEDQAV